MSEKLVINVTVEANHCNSSCLYFLQVLKSELYQSYFGMVKNRINQFYFKINFLPLKIIFFSTGNNIKNFSEIQALFNWSPGISRITSA